MRTFEPEAASRSISEILSNESSHFRDKKEELEFILSILDLTTLEGSDTTKTIENLCEKAQSFSSKGYPNVAAVCVYPVFVRQAKSIMQDTNIHVASVAGAFPSGQSPIHVKIAEIEYAVEEGADEIDMVISRGKFLQGNYKEVADEISAIKKACRNSHLKVILETGEIGDLNAIYRASVIALEAGGDFIKTSTGKISPAATPESAYVMLYAIKDHYDKTGQIKGFKPAGGISTPDQAMIYVKLAETILGPQWLNSSLLRIGASRLATNLVTALDELK